MNPKKSPWKYLRKKSWISIKIQSYYGLPWVVAHNVPFKLHLYECLSQKIKSWKSYVLLKPKDYFLLHVSQKSSDLELFFWTWPNFCVSCIFESWDCTFLLFVAGQFSLTIVGSRNGNWKSWILLSHNFFCKIPWD